MSEKDPAFYMRRALRLARRGRGKTSPNPMVGAVVVREDRIVGEGYHHAPGSPHAEVLALCAAGEQAKGATLYTTLEPCCHTKKRTPPCTDAIIESGVSRVVLAMEDPNPLVCGKGFERLRKAGIQVTSGLLCSEAEVLNAAFVKYMKTGKPFVTLKAAMTLDGRIATASGESKWISGEKSRREVDRLRAEADGVLVGIGTVLADDPMLCLKKVKGKNPLRIVIDPELKMPPQAKLVTTAADTPTLLLTTAKAPSDRIEQMKSSGVRVDILPEAADMIPFETVLTHLGKMGMTHLLIEGGGGVNGAALRSGGVDRVIFYIAPRLLCGDDAVSVVSGGAIPNLSAALSLENVKLGRMGEDIRIEGKIRKTAS
ncbi:MAG: bifunctional diaminohydroxyphosphoribosylaminopyrimidine deaminase/5-amino-6-(5-phosphoribosylamino)uracil reductase RibD [Nitrospiria bacterium]